jgi:hypothetical protein
VHWQNEKPSTKREKHLKYKDPNGLMSESTQNWNHTWADNPLDRPEKPLQQMAVGTETSVGKCNLKAQWELDACNSSYSGGRDQENCCSKPAWADSSQDPISNKPITRKGLWSGSRFKPRYCTRQQQTTKKQKHKTHKEIHYALFRMTEIEKNEDANFGPDAEKMKLWCFAGRI